MSDARELLEQTLRVNHPSIARRLGDTLRATLDLADKLHYYGVVREADGDIGRASAYYESVAQIRHTITAALAGDPDE